MVVPLKRIDKIRWEIPKFDKRMRVPGRVYADEVLLEMSKRELSAQEELVTTLTVLLQVLES